MTLTTAQLDALRELDVVFSGSKSVVVGATALGFYFEMAWRHTADVDLAVAIDLDDFQTSLTKLDGWKRPPGRPHEIQSPDGARIDVLPVGEAVQASGQLEWERDLVMNVTGFDLVFRLAEVHDVGGAQVLVAPPTVITLLKMAAYLDRPFERLRDLGDIAHLLDIYVDEDSERRWGEAKDQDFDLAPAYLLGLDVGVIREKKHCLVIDDFLRAIGDPEQVEYAQMTRRGPSRWGNQKDPLARRLEAFRSGLDDS